MTCTLTLFTSLHTFSQGFSLSEQQHISAQVSPARWQEHLWGWHFVTATLHKLQYWFWCWQISWNDEWYSAEHTEWSQLKRYMVRDRISIPLPYLVYRITDYLNNLISRGTILHTSGCYANMKAACAIQTQFSANSYPSLLRRHRQYGTVCPSLYTWPAVGSEPQTFWS